MPHSKPVSTRHRSDESLFLGLSFLLMACLCFTTVELRAGESATTVSETKTISGTLASVDPEQGKATLRTDLGQSIFFTFSKPLLVEQFRIGDRVTVQLKGNGELIKMIETPVPELRSPAP
ncbi:hypothetical protein YTPLAS18_15720 [Nitrospira sp.]|nr:hypothetical protein YTPLAS18_15720 [Nitrospira sp.]